VYQQRRLKVGRARIEPSDGNFRTARARRSTVEPDSNSSTATQKGTVFWYETGQLVKASVASPSSATPPDATRAQPRKRTTSAVAMRAAPSIRNARPKSTLFAMSFSQGRSRMSSPSTIRPSARARSSRRDPLRVSCAATTATAESPSTTKIQPKASVATTVTPSAASPTMAAARAMPMSPTPSSSGHWARNAGVPSSSAASLIIARSPSGNVPLSVGLRRASRPERSLNAQS
jgi:hypothetical protein